jgi:hypothetical protein
MMARRESSDDDDSPSNGTMIRLEVHVLGRSALLPDSNVVRPAPTHFTHELAVDTPFHLDRNPAYGESDRILPAGTRVVVAATRGERCRVVDGRGLAVVVPRSHLHQLPA